MKKTISYLLPLVIGIGLLYFVFNKIDFREVWEVFLQANYILVALALILSLLSHVLRGARWIPLLKPLGKTPSLYNTTVAVLLGYVTNLVFPRAGEVARVVSLQKSEDIDFEKSLGTVVAERVIDLGVLLVLVVINLVLEYDRIIAFVQDFNINFGVWMLGLFLLFALLFLLAYKYRVSIFEIPLLAKFKPFLIGLWDGLLSVFKLEKPWMFIAQSFGIWILYFLVTMLLCYAIDIGQLLSPLAIFTVFVMGTIGMAIPTTGGIGSYHLLVGKILLLYGLTTQQGVVLAIFLHTLNGILFVLLFGVIALLMGLLKRA